MNIILETSFSWVHGQASAFLSFVASFFLSKAPALPGFSQHIVPGFINMAFVAPLNHFIIH